MSSVTVLMSTYNGEKYIHEQIKSLVVQKNVDVSILVRDDGSSDGTLEILEYYKKQGVLSWYNGENIKTAKSFLDLVMNAPESEYYAFCDQDDVWNEDKLARAINMLEKYGDDNIPRLYCSNYQLVDEKLNSLPDNGHVSTTTFSAALVSSCCTGCTVVFNKALKEILLLGLPQVIVMHDDWVHKVCLAVGGTVYYDEVKTLKYRQHGGNVDGGIHTPLVKVKQICVRILKRDCVRSEQLKEILRIYRKYMPSKNIEFLEAVAFYRDKKLVERLKLICSTEIRTAYKRLDRGYKIAILLRYF